MVTRSATCGRGAVRAGASPAGRGGCRRARRSCSASSPVSPRRSTSSAAPSDWCEPEPLAAARASLREAACPPQLISGHVYLKESWFSRSDQACREVKCAATPRLRIELDLRHDRTRQARGMIPARRRVDKAFVRGCGRPGGVGSRRRTDSTARAEEHSRSTKAPPTSFSPLVYDGSAIRRPRTTPAKPRASQCAP